MGIRSAVYGIVIALAVGLAAAGGWCWRHQRSAAVSVVGRADDERLSKRVAAVLGRMNELEAAAIAAEQQDPKRSLSAFQDLQTEMGQINTAGCPQDFQIAFLRCTNALDRIVAHTEDLRKATKLEGDQLFASLAAVVVTRGLSAVTLHNKGSASDALVAQSRSAIIKDRDQYLDGKAALAEIALKYGVTAQEAKATRADSATAAIADKQTITVPAGRVFDLPLSFPAERTPGRIRGHWTSQGKSAGIAGAKDDTLVKFTIRGSNNAVLQRLDHPVSGNFDIRYAGGTFTLTFDNSGIVRSSGRVVSVEWTYAAE
ncbi:MAG TPA: hypothetical protein VFE47_20875 [Tepidisphaeraceae bacterium]|jgi:hypothetical protein|nr:hypothetical protein [Tepidisphaeraceae bacterium]